MTVAATCKIQENGHEVCKSAPGHAQPQRNHHVCVQTAGLIIHGAYPCSRLTSEEAAEPPLRRRAVTGCQMIQQAFCLSTLSPHTLCEGNLFLPFALEREREETAASRPARSSVFTMTVQNQRHPRVLLNRSPRRLNRFKRGHQV